MFTPVEPDPKNKAYWDKIVQDARDAVDKNRQESISLWEDPE